MSEDALTRLDNLKALGLSPALLAERVGGTPAYWSDLLRGKKSFGEKIARKIEGALGLPRNAMDSVGGAIKLKTEPSLLDVRIPQYDAGGSMGSGRLLLEDQPGVIKSWSVDSEWIRRNVRGHTSAANLCIVTGFGPSMRPMFNPGDPLLVDRGIVTCDVDAVYFFRVGSHGFIKMLQRIPTPGGLLLRAKSKNPDYDPFDITEGMDFEVLGKVLKVWCSEEF